MPLTHEIAEGIRFDRFACEYDSPTTECLVRTEVRNRLVEIVRMLQPRIVVDVGCGSGAALIVLSPAIEFGVGLDVSREMLRVAERQASKAAAANLRFLFGSFHDLNGDHDFWPTGTRPDVVVQNYALHHLPHDEKRIAIAGMVKAVSAARGTVVLGDLMFFDDPAGLEAEYPLAGYDPQNDRPETAHVMATMLEDLGCVLRTHRIHPLAGVVVGTLGHRSSGRL
jgi:SAM-dependent methyltransferase